MAKQDDFQARLARINTGQTTVANNVQVPKRREYVQLTRGQEIRENAKYPLSIVGAFFLGGLAILIGRYARFHLMGVDVVGADLMTSTMIDLGFAAGIAFVIRSALDFEEPVHLDAKSMGITATVATMHNAVHADPGLWATVFSEEWVSTVTTITQPNSIYFGGISFLL